eukprot:CAMPEP_0205823024 /NCGR_PEP_ID=MMETSP0206-20130828/14751_1 /ASSEMBLY_ACC=CAM_ASM_000279 /TAXON_ID=36767 /ORGANISM="Euplotes focardii, Strain TN1" /LENGTH=45 /DNA_ID= /DNA_START= /DNA_END= /DNA_ORIENTATION=
MAMTLHHGENEKLVKGDSDSVVNELDFFDNSMTDIMDHPEPSTAR